ncbi:MAG TPA: CDP-alcohol phosphatidyltransferase family protein [Candidatus Omnitrophota bacterium]|nr:CDP-alcohol phosphatidyltransferase family protein [Candidatus Omnitrophota bacterium]
MKNDLLIKYGDLVDYLNRRISGPVARALARTAVQPNAVTYVRSAMVVAAMYLFMRASIWSIFWAGMFIQAADILDYVDGDLARLTGRSSRFGEWLEYVENSLQGTFGSLLGFFLVYGLYARTHDVSLWIVLFFLCFGVHMKKALILTPVKTDHWIFNLLQKSSFQGFSEHMARSPLLTAAKSILWISTRELNLVFAVSVLLPVTHRAFGFDTLHYALVTLAFAHNLTWLGIGYYQLRGIKDK